MRLAACLALLACATPPAPDPREQVAGCWISRDDAGGAVTMRWLPNPGGDLRGELLRYGARSVGGRQTYVLRQSHGEDLFCFTDAEETCWSISPGVRGEPQPGFATIESDDERLRIAVAAPYRVIFDGGRDGCD